MQINLDSKSFHLHGYYTLIVVLLLYIFFLVVVMDVSEVEIAKNINLFGLKLCKFLLLQACKMFKRCNQFSTIFHFEIFQFNKFLGVICTFEVVYTKPSGDLDLMGGFCQILGALKIVIFWDEFWEDFCFTYFTIKLMSQLKNGWNWKAIVSFWGVWAYF